MTPRQVKTVREMIEYHDQMEVNRNLVFDNPGASKHRRFLACLRSFLPKSKRGKL